MKRTLLLLSLLLLAMPSTAQYQRNTEDIPAGYYMNPIFPGDYPDPSILRDGDDFYMVHSSFEYLPGLLIWHSKDLINWEPVSHALNTYLGSIWAPDLVKYEDRYYIYLPVNGTNYVVYADDIKGPWSDPIELKVSNIDPGHIADEDGNRYLYFSSGSYVPLSKDGLRVTGELTHSYGGWPIPREWSIECFCMEGPKIFKRGDYYYLVTAEGGTAGPPTGHMVVVARSESPIGPWENHPDNPILRTESASERWWSVGHATPFSDQNGDWWMIFHGYEKGFQNMGRQTMMLPLEWTDDNWFQIPDGVDLEKPIRKPDLPESDPGFDLSDDFNGNSLKLQWRFFGDYDTDRFELSNGKLVIKGKGEGIADSSPLLTMPSDHSYEAEVEISIEGSAIGGLVFYYNDRAYSGILTDGKNVLTNIRGWQFVTEADVVKEKVILKVRNENHLVNMYYSTDGKEWIKIENSLEVSGYHHNILSGFMAMRIGLSSFGDGKVSFDNFKYRTIKQK